jgi:hypothetical protein
VGGAWVRVQKFRSCLLRSRLERTSCAEFLLHCNFRFRLNPLNIGPHQGREPLRSNGNLAADDPELARQLKNAEMQNRHSEAWTSADYVNQLMRVRPQL